MKIEIPYVNRFLRVDVPPKNLLFDISPNNVASVSDFKGTILTALENPIGTQKLNEILAPDNKVVIISDDNTRPTPTKKIIPILLDLINECGIPDSRIEIVISSGTHRAMYDHEIDEKYGDRILSRVKIHPHHYNDPSELVDFGYTARGTKIWVNRHVVEADIKIALGNIIPHHPTGWSAGAKAVLPGVGGEETVAQMHFLGSKDPALGRVDTEMRKEMEDFAEKIGLDFILNVILNRDGELVGAVAGHFIQAHRDGIKISTKVYGLPIPAKADLTISSTSPVDYDFFQGDKGITSAEPATKDGGEIIMVSGCLEGISPAHPELSDYVGKLNNDQIWAMIISHQVKDPLTAAEAIVINDILGKMHITACTEGLSKEICDSMGMNHLLPERLNKYIQDRVRASSDISIGIIRQSAEVFPYISYD